MYVTNNHWIKIRETAGGISYFTHCGKRYKLNDFIRCHNNPWESCVFPDYIHGHNYDMANPLFIQLSESGDTVKIWREISA